MAVVCLSTEPGIRIGTGVTFPRGAELCMDGPVDAAKYRADTKLFCTVTYPAGVARPNIKTYFGGELKKTYYGDPDSSGQFVWWESSGWTGVVRFDFCDGADVVCSRSTEWTPVPPVRKLVRATIVRIGLPESAKAGDRVVANVVVKNTGAVTLMFSVKLLNLDTGKRYGGFVYTPYIQPGEEAAVSISLLMPAGTDPLNLVAEVYRGTMIQDLMTASVARKIPDLITAPVAHKIPDLITAPVAHKIPEPEVKGACYIKFDIPVLDLLPGIPCEWWGDLPLLPGFKKTTEP